MVLQSVLLYQVKKKNEMGSLKLLTMLTLKLDRYHFVCLFVLFIVTMVIVSMAMLPWQCSQ